MRQPQKAQKRKTRAELNEEGRERKRQKKHRGHSAGSRANPNDKQSTSGQSSRVKDARIGSKKPIDLLAPTDVKPEKISQPKKEVLTPEKELELLENDSKLDALLIKLEDGDSISEAEQDYVDKTLDRIDELMMQLGIALEEDDEENEFLPSGQPDIMQLLKRKD